MSDITETMLHLRPQNERAPISKLFDELLSSIFIVLIPSWSSIGYYFGPTYQLARAISQVCSRWRQLSLGLPSLWKSIELRYGTSQWKEELFRRSANAPFIEIRSPSNESFDEILGIPGVLPRIRSFDGRMSFMAWVRLFSSAQQLGARLEHLSFDYGPGEPDERTSLQFHGHAPPLRYLMMCKTDNVDLASPFFSNLRHVNIEQDALSVPYLVSIAENMPFLERLHLKAPVALGADDPLPHRVRFPRLRHLHYDDHNLLKCVDIPQECMLHTSCDWTNRTAAIANFIPRLIYDHVHNGNPWLAIEIRRGFSIIHNCKSFCWNDDPYD